MNETKTIDPDLQRLERQALIVGIVAMAVCLGGALLNPGQFFRSYLVAYLFWIGIVLGGVAIVMLHHLVGGGWGFLIRRALESSFHTIPLLGVLLIPILFGMPDLYLWARPEAVAGDEVLQHKSAYLNVGAFVVRGAIYFLIWGVIAYLLGKWSLQQDETGDPSLNRRMRRLSAPGLAVMGLTITFASVDWVMSLDPHWFSTIYGFLFIAGDVLSTLAFGVCTVYLLGHKKPLSDYFTRDRLHDIGNLMLAFVMLWAYIAFSQYLIIWSGNLPEETTWYVRRSGSGWVLIAVVLILFHFALPFVLLLSRKLKRGAGTLVGVAVMVLLMRLVDLYWQVAPTFSEDEVRLHWMDFLTPVAIGGLWLAVFAWRLKDKPLVPIHDPDLAELKAEAGHE